MKTRLRSIIERTVAYGLILCAIIALLYFLGSVNRSQKDNLLQKQQELEELNQKLVDARKNIVERQEKVADIKAELAERRLHVNQIFEGLIGRADEYTAFIEEVKHRAIAYNITISDTTYEPPASTSESGNYLEFRFNMRITGNYNDVKQFLWEMENRLQRLVKVSQLEILSPLADEQGNMSIRLRLSTFFVP